MDVHRPPTSSKRHTRSSTVPYNVPVDVETSTVGDEPLGPAGNSCQLSPRSVPLRRATLAALGVLPQTSRKHARCNARTERPEPNTGDLDHRREQDRTKRPVGRPRIRPTDFEFGGWAMPFREVFGEEIDRPFNDKFDEGGSSSRPRWARSLRITAAGSARLRHSRRSRRSSRRFVLDRDHRRLCPTNIHERPRAQNPTRPVQGDGSPTSC